VAIARPQLAENPNDAQIYELLARSLALAGKRAEAIDYAEKALKMRETEQDATTGNYVRYQAVRVFIQAGAYDRALELMDRLMTGYYSELTPAWLRLEPVFKPLKGNPKFEAMAR
jgi:tetratricopeptide (TPR) repeat protein